MKITTEGVFFFLNVAYHIDQFQNTRADVLSKATLRMSLRKKVLYMKVSFSEKKKRFSVLFPLRKLKDWQICDMKHYYLVHPVNAQCTTLKLNHRTILAL